MDLRVRCEVGHYIYDSKVYAVDSVRHEFLVADYDGYFHWVDTGDCTVLARALEEDDQ